MLQPAAQVGGELTVPGDKSISHRALMLGGIAAGRTAIHGFLPSEDCHATLAALRAMGVTVEEHSATTLTVHGAGERGLAAPAQALDMGNSGTALRLFMGLLAAQPFDVTLTGDASLMQRPMERVAKPLRAMGAAIETTDGRPPVRILGGRPLTAIDYALPVPSAQVKSALLLAGLYARGVTRVTEPVPTRDHTERMLQGFGVSVERAGSSVSIAGGQRLTGTRIDVPADISSAAFFLVAGCLAAREGLVLRNVGVNPTRTGVIDILRLMGADIRIENARESGGEPSADLVVRAGALRGIRIPEALVPLAIDEFPALFIAAAAAEGCTELRGAGELRVKETDRLAAMAEGLGRLGVRHELLPDGIRIDGGPLSGGTVDSHGDHRIAMAFAVASLRARGPLEILDVANVATSFPDFVPLARAAGLAIS
ncbi:MAG: 3-phosphoshikimate 1-carboxyvinyltransferase [Steroidobacteraceae bacterium]|nr:3-phosphoshikimate 1-carboxyvinyltransferase [Steroidobacteraceae bacterium]